MALPNQTVLVADGDVIVRIDGQPATLAALRAARDSRDSTEIEILRKRRSIIVSFEGRR